MFVAGSTTEPLMIAIAFIGNGGAYLIKKNKTKQNWMFENIIFDFLKWIPILCLHVLCMF